MWNDNVYSINGGTITVNTDSDGNVVSIKANVTFSAVVSFILWTKFGMPYPFKNTSYTMNGCSDGSGSTYKQDIFYRKSGVDSVLMTVLNGNATADFSVLNNETVSVVAVRIVIYAGALTNQMFYPMIRLATETDATFAPYTNICPISGSTEALITRTGKNLFNKNGSKTDNKFLTSSGNTTSDPNWYITDFVKVLGGANIVLHWNDSYTANAPSICWYDKNKNFIGGKNYGYSNPVFVTLPSNACYIKFSAQKFSIESTLQVEYGSSPTTYEPYNGNQYTIQLNGTRYGGTLDVDTGVMTVTHELAVLDGSEDELWGVFDSNKRVGSYYLASKIARTASASDLIGIYCDKFKEVTANTTFNGNIGISGDGDGRILIADGTKSMTKESWTAYLAENPMQVAYPLRYPFTVQLSPTQIQLLTGTNNLYASTGDISVDVVRGVSGAIDGLQAQTNVLSSRVPAPPTSGADEKYLRGDGVWTHAELPMEYMQTGTGSYDCTYRYFRYGRMISLWIENITCSSSDVGQELEICTLDDPRSPWPIGITPIYGIGIYNGTQPVTASNIAYFYMDGDVVKVYAEKEFFYGNAYIVFTDSYSA